VTLSESKSDRVCAACGRKIRNMHQLFCFVASALQDAETGSQERFKRCLQTSVSSPERSPVNKKMLRKGVEESASQKRQVEGDDDAEIADNISLGQLGKVVSGGWVTSGTRDHRQTTLCVCG